MLLAPIKCKSKMPTTDISNDIGYEVGQNFILNPFFLFYLVPVLSTIKAMFCTGTRKKCDGKEKGGCRYSACTLPYFNLHERPTQKE